MNMNTKKFCKGVDAAADLLKALANPHRLKILCRLHASECTVGELEAFVGINQSALSQHLARLRHDGIVATRREAQNIFYRIQDASALRIVKELYALYCGAPSRLKK